MIGENVYETKYCAYVDISGFTGLIDELRAGAHVRGGSAGSARNHPPTRERQHEELAHGIPRSEHFACRSNLDPREQGRPSGNVARVGDQSRRATDQNDTFRDARFHESTLQTAFLRILRKGAFHHLHQMPCDFTIAAMGSRQFSSEAVLFVRHRIRPHRRGNSSIYFRRSHGPSFRKT